jgi:glycosyltransferase involved in cell wall biosynthesis
VLLFVGVFRRYKGLDTLIRSFDRLQEELEVKLALVGEGPEEGAVRDAVSRRGLTDDVELLGHVSKGELLAAYAEADAFVLPSPNIRESFGVVVSEALAMGTPVVATAKSGSGHFLSEHDIGTIVEPDDPESLADGIRWLLTDRNRYQSEASAAREFAVTTLSWERLVDEYIDLYESVLS